MYRTNTCGELRIENVGQEVTLAGWVQRSRENGWYDIHRLARPLWHHPARIQRGNNADLCAQANKLGREFVIQIKGIVNERYAKNDKMPTGDIEIIVSELNVLNASLTPPFTIEANTDGGDDLRMKYRYLDLRRENVRANLELRHKFCIAVRNFLDSKGFLEIETPILIGSNPRGRTRLHRAVTHESRTVLCTSSESSNAQTVADGCRYRPLLPDCQMFPRRRLTCRPSARTRARGLG